MNKKLFTERMKLADLIASNYSLILMMPRFGIPLGFGDKSVQEICTAHNVPTDFVLLICNVYTFNDYLPDDTELTSTDMSLLVPYLLASHHYYIEERLPHIERHLHNIADKAGDRYGTVLKQYFSDYQNEVRDHFSCEERDVFPSLLQLQKGEREKTPIARKFIESHGNIEDKLTDLTQIVYKYLPGNVLPEESCEVVFDILQLASDLAKHALIEEKILLPYVTWLERGRK